MVFLFRIRCPEVLFPPADTFEEQFEYVERIYRAVQDACEAQGSVVFGDGSVSFTLSYVIDEDDQYRGLWRILGLIGRENCHLK